MVPVIESLEWNLIIEEIQPSIANLRQVLSAELLCLPEEDLLVLVDLLHLLALEG